jgi:3-deoxy-D-arabino-heptulosonate 7-phosphate (DAHP) synthase
MEKRLNINPIKEWLPQLNNPLLIAGPCSLESEEQALATARLLAKDPGFLFIGVASGNPVHVRVVLKGLVQSD